jgi:hypothetical protein
LVVLLVVHGLIHAIGFAKAFELAKIPRLKRPIGRPAGVLWLSAGLGFLVAAVLLVASPGAWWFAAALAVLLSQVAIFVSWSDAKFGTLVNLVVLVPLAISVLDLRGASYRSLYLREVESRLSASAAPPAVTEADLARLPLSLQTYLRRVGVVGRPHVRDFRATFRGQMRSRHDAAWMDIRAEQHEFFDDPARLFYIQSSLYGIPFEALHAYVGLSATMRVRALSLFDIVDARGPEMNQSETVTMFNDMCLLAPGSLVGANVVWKEVDERHLVGAFTNAGNTIRAELTFDDRGDLVGFVSNDRFQSADGKTYRNFPWSTPVGDYRDFGGVRVAARGEAIWREPQGDFSYARFELESIEYNVKARDAARLARQ